MKTVKSLGIFKDYKELNKFINNENLYKKNFLSKSKLNIKKTVFIQYSRNYFELVNKKLRLTVDKNLKIFNVYPLNYINLDKTILELKYKVSQSSYVNNFIYENKLNNRNQKFSKYVNSFIELNDSGFI